MPRIRVTSFSGMVPRLTSRNIDSNQSQMANNCLLTSSALSPWRDKKKIITLAKTSIVNSIYLHGNGTANKRWLHWNENVDVVKGPIAGDATERTYFTGTDAPRFTNTALVDVGGNGQYPEDSYILGIPPSNVVPTVALNGVGSGPVYSRAYVYTLVSEFGEEGMPSPVSSILAWQAGHTVDLTNIGKVTTLAFSAGTVTATCTGHGYSTSDKILHGGANQKDYNGVYTITVVDANSYTYTITGTPATPATGTIASIKVSSTTTVGKRNITKKRIYRVVTSVTGAAYLYASEINIGTVTYNDAIADSALGEILPSTYWAEPPSGMKGLILLPNGVMAGFVGNILYMSVPYIPYAWPTAYKQTINGIVALSYIGTTIIVLTNTIPHLVLAQDPEQVSVFSRENDPYPCVSKRSVVRTEQGVIYASNYGLVSGSTSGFKSITENLITNREWENYKSSTIHAYYYDGRYIGFYTRGLVSGMEDGSGFVFDPGSQLASWTELDQYAYAGFHDDQSGELYLSYWNGINNVLYQWNGEGTNISYQWKSKLFIDDHPTCLQAARLHFKNSLTDSELASYTTQRAAQIAANTTIFAGLATMRGALGTVDLAASDVPLAYVNFINVLTLIQENQGVVFKYYANGNLKYQKTVFDNKPFRMPGGYLSYGSEFELLGTATITEVELASTLSELAQ